MAGAVPDNIDKPAYTGAPPPSGLSADEQHAYDQLAFFYKHGLAFAQEMGNRPQTLDDVLDNITLYWLSNTAVSSARLYWENKLGFFSPKHVAIPVAVSVVPDEIYAAPRSWAEGAD